MINISKPIIEEEEIKAVIAVLKSGMIVQGKKTALLEQKLAEYCQTKYAVAFNSGTAAIHSALYALDIKPGDEVITSPFTFVATANPILMQGASIVFADISKEDYNLDPVAVEKKISKKTKAIIPVDLFGQIYDYARIKKIAQKYKLKIVEDACQAVGAKQNGKKAGNFGDIAAFSLYATKNIMCGEGGFITTDSEQLAQKTKMFRHHGQSEKNRYEYLDLGYNYRMTDISAAIALVQLKKADKFNNLRIKNAGKLNLGLAGVKGLILPKVMLGNRHVYHQYVIRITDQFTMSRDELLVSLKNNGINAGIYYPKPLHLNKHFEKFGYKAGDFPKAEKVAKEVIALPVHPSLTDKDIDYIINRIKNYAK